ncbi:patatin-like phospholipase family protein [Segnochrobactrum spirostomi]|uniref:patatin-like phospholipase family protein n=1 Tax=Segnochrobactrum spirostomi TaxID=2608987 RepID=UPI001FE8FB97|nr:patatin-like phospholipase family protein [Segnochrobactrum spirostomi]
MNQFRPGDRQSVEDFSAIREIVKANYQNVVLVLQGGGALGSYQPGVVEVLDEIGININWVAGISIGAINSAIIAGNPPEHRVEKLRGFWDVVTSRVQWSWLPPGDHMRGLFNQLSSFSAMMFGQPGFFAPRVPPPHLHPAGTLGAVSYYDTAPLKTTLEQFVDFDYLNSKSPVRLSVGAVNVRSGNFVYFDSQERTIRPEHVMASGALPPGFPPVEIDGELYWDGGLVSNTPLSYVLGRAPSDCSIIFQVDLFSALGSRPRNLPDVQEREKDIQFSSRTRLNTDMFRQVQRMRQSIEKLLDKLPPEMAELPEYKELTAYRMKARVNIVHLIYRRKQYDRDYKDYEFSRNTMLDHWKAGRDTMLRTLRHPDWFSPPDESEAGVVTHDIHRDADD